MVVSEIELLTEQSFAGSAGAYVTGYCCEGFGCLTEPPPAQSPDPKPLPDIESGYTPPQTYTASKTACAECPEDYINVSVVDLVPNMTGATTPSGTASASVQAAGFEAWKAFDGDYVTYWGAGVDVTAGTLTYQFAVAKNVARYSITPGPLAVGAPTDWTFLGSNNGTDWTELDAREGFIEWSAQTARSFPISNQTAYKYFRLNVTDVVDPGSDGIELRVSALNLFAAANQKVCRTAAATSEATQQAADAEAYAAAQIAAGLALECMEIYSASVQYTAQCPGGTPSLTVSKTAHSFVSYTDAESRAMQLAQAEAEADLEC